MLAESENCVPILSHTAVQNASLHTRAERTHRLPLHVVFCELNQGKTEEMVSDAQLLAVLHQRMGFVFGCLGIDGGGRDLKADWGPAREVSQQVEHRKTVLAPGKSDKHPISLPDHLKIPHSLSNETTKVFGCVDENAFRDRTGRGRDGRGPRAQVPADPLRTSICCFFYYLFRGSVHVLRRRVFLLFLFCPNHSFSFFFPAHPPSVGLSSLFLPFLPCIHLRQLSCAVHYANTCPSPLGFSLSFLAGARVILCTSCWRLRGCGRDLQFLCCGVILCLHCLPLRVPSCRFVFSPVRTAVSCRVETTGVLLRRRFFCLNRI
mmetsp:Transcript_23925/g.46991  ORF Transcript_23925/g.46991 Transcript_23925/m.46991 type:complete len:320 (+) Transcript_23925:993-1952(+)